MFLPKIYIKLFVIIFLPGFLFLFFSAPLVLADNYQIPAQNTRNTNPYTIQPIPDPTGDEKIGPIPKTSDYQIQQINIIDDIVGGIKGGAAWAISEITGVAASAATTLIEGSLYIVQKAALVQLVGNTAEKLLDCAAKGECVSYFDDLHNTLTGPNPNAQFGVLGISQEISNVMLAIPIPVSSEQYLASINPFETAQAQSGAEALGASDVILDIWTVVRNASYALLVVVLVIVGFLIMIRWKTDPRTAVTLQNSLPRIAIAMLLITFSFAIAGLMVDGTRILSVLFDQLLSGTLQSSFSAKAGIAGLFGITGGILGLILEAPVIYWTFLGMLFLLLILGIILLVIWFIIAIKLLTRYVMFLLLVMFAPFFFLAGALPNGGGAISFWFKRTGAAMVAIPATGLVMNLAFLIGFSGFGQAELPQITEGIIPLGGALDEAFGWFFFAPFVGIALLFFATKVPDAVDELFGVRSLTGGGRGGGGGFFGGVVGAPYRGLVATGQFNRGIEGTRSLATQFAGSGGLAGRIGRGALRMPLIGTPATREQAGIASTEEQTKNKQVRVARQAERIADVKAAETAGAARTSKPTPGPGSTSETAARTSTQQTKAEEDQAQTQKKTGTEDYG